MTQPVISRDHLQPFDEDKEDIEIAAAREAEMLLVDGGLLSRTFGKLKDRYASKLLASDLTQHELREESYRLYRAVGEIEGELRRIVETGKLAAVARDQRDAKETH